MLQFLITALLVVISAQVISLSQGHVSPLALLIPALWMLPKRGVAGVMLFAALIVYGFTLPLQSVELSVAVWMILPMLMVAFSKRSSTSAKILIFVVMAALQIGIIMTQLNGTLAGSAAMTIIQTMAVIVTWYALQHYKVSKHYNWWCLGLLIPLWFLKLPYTIVLALCLTAIITSIETLSRLNDYPWRKLLCWSLPTIAFATLMVSPNIQVANPVFVVWLCLLGTAWITDYVLRVIEHQE